MAKYNIAMDGPGGAGKSSVSKLIAKKLGIIYVDTGALYRAIALHMTNVGIATTDKENVINELKNVKLSLTFTDHQVLMLDGEEVGDKIRTPEMSMGASNVSAIPEVRAFLLDLQRKIAKKNSVIMDGRDIGTVILPDAELKIFLVASVILAAVSVILTLYIPILTGQAVDYIIGPAHVDFAAVFDVLVTMAIVIVLTAIVQWLMNACNNKIA